MQRKDQGVLLELNSILVLSPFGVGMVRLVLHPGEEGTGVIPEIAVAQAICMKISPKSI